MMLLVTFTPKDPTPAFEEALKAMGNWSNRIPGAWLLETTLTPRQVRDVLSSHLKKDGQMVAGNRIFVARIAADWAGSGLGAGFPEWIQRRSFDIPTK